MTTATSTSVFERVQSGFNFQVNKFPLSGPDNLATPFYGLFRSDTGECIGRPVSNDYVPHTSDDVLALVEAASVAFEGLNGVGCYFRDGHRVWLKPSRAERREIHRNDSVWPHIFIDASYDGRAFSATVGVYRDLCSNLMRFQTLANATVRIRHSSNLRNEMDELIERFSQLNESIDSVYSFIERMESKRVRFDDFIRSLYGEPPQEQGRALTVYTNRISQIFTRLVGENASTMRDPIQSMDWEVSGWQAYNAVQGYMQHASTRRGNVTPETRIFSALDAPILKQAEQLILAA